jgi:uncharacterized protein DUF3828
VIRIVHRRNLPPDSCIIYRRKKYRKSENKFANRLFLINYTNNKVGKLNIKSNKTALLLAICLIILTGFNCVNAQNTPSEPPAVKMLRDFYTNYMNEFTNLSQGHEQRTNAILKKYCTAKLIGRIPKLSRQTESDPFLKAQDSDSAWTKSLGIKKDTKNPGVYIVSYRDGGNTLTTIHLFVVEQKDTYMISNVW